MLSGKDKVHFRMDAGCVLRTVDCVLEGRVTSCCGLKSQRLGGNNRWQNALFHCLNQAVRKLFIYLQKHNWLSSSTQKPYWPNTLEQREESWSPDRTTHKNPSLLFGASQPSRTPKKSPFWVNTELGTPSPSIHTDQSPLLEALAAWVSLSKPHCALQAKTQSASHSKPRRYFPITWNKLRSLFVKPAGTQSYLWATDASRSFGCCSAICVLCLLSQLERIRTCQQLMRPDHLDVAQQSAIFVC